MKYIRAIVLAAGKGRRMKSRLPKVLHALCGRPMISWVMDTLKAVGVGRILVVVGYNKDLVIPALGNAEFVVQKELLGTADALRLAREKLGNYRGTVLVIAGDVPLIKNSTLKRLINAHKKSGSKVTILTAVVEEPAGYGRILRGCNNRVVKILEEAELDNRLREVKEINSGIYCFEAPSLFEGLNKIKLNQRKKEYYLTDIIAIMVDKKEKINTFTTSDSNEVLGINTRHDLAAAANILNRRIIDGLMSSGVSIVDPATTFLEAPIEVGQDTIIFPFSVVEKNVIIGKNCRIGPFCHLREGTVVEDSVELGNFVELVRSRIDEFSKVKHLSYLGDVFVGKKVNIGAGTIVANFDGKKKNRTIVEDKAFVGSGSILIAPVKIGKRAVTGAGAVVTRNRNVPAGRTVVGVPAHILGKCEVKDGE